MNFEKEFKKLGFEKTTDNETMLVYKDKKHYTKDLSGKDREFNDTRIIIFKKKVNRVFLKRILEGVENEPFPLTAELLDLIQKQLSNI
nr:MAG TPA: hypothetical protein [Caudoviricetes sp.]